MPNLKASKKSVKVIEKRTNANHDYTAKVKNYIKKCEKAIEAKDKEQATTFFKEMQIAIDKAISKGLVKKNTGDREKSRLSDKIKNIVKD